MFYGSPDAPEVLVIRRFRDEILLASAPGKAAVRLYYLLSLPLAAFISRGSFLRAATKAILLRPILLLLKLRKLGVCLQFVTYQKEVLHHDHIWNPVGLARHIYMSGEQDDEIDAWLAEQSSNAA